jgi:alpha,alpha-trehalose phosphorylase
MASLAGTWLAIVAGFGGMRDYGGELSFMPRLPARIERLAFAVTIHGDVLRVTVEHGHATYAVDQGEIALRHHGEEVTVRAGEAPVTLAIPAPDPATPAPAQPPGRAPHRRRREG